MWDVGRFLGAEGDLKFQSGVCARVCLFDLSLDVREQVQLDFLLLIRDDVLLGYSYLRIQSWEFSYSGSPPTVCPGPLWLLVLCIWGSFCFWYVFWLPAAERVMDRPRDPKDLYGRDGETGRTGRGELDG